MTPPGMEDMGQQIRKLFSTFASGKTHKRTLTVKAARVQLIEEEAGKLVNDDDIREALMFGQSAIDNATDSSVDGNGSNPAAAA